MKKLFGVIVALTTPFNADNSIDHFAVRGQIEFLVEKGMNCLYPCGTTGEMYLLTVAERKQLAETVVDQAATRLPVFIHIGAMTTNDAVHLAKHAYQIGADGIAAITPSYFRMSEREILQYYKDICHSVLEDFPVYVYMIPQLSGNDVSPELLEAICQACPNIIGVKYSHQDMQILQKYKRVKHGTLSVLTGADDLFLPALTLGMDGVVTGCAGPFPEIFTSRAEWRFCPESAIGVDF